MTSAEALELVLEEMLGKIRAKDKDSAWLYAEFDAFLLSLADLKTATRFEVARKNEGTFPTWHAPEGWQPEEAPGTAYVEFTDGPAPAVEPVVEVKEEEAKVEAKPAAKKAAKATVENNKE